jgi:hypothetical protein
MSKIPDHSILGRFIYDTHRLEDVQFGNIGYGGDKKEDELIQEIIDIESILQTLPKTSAKL